MNVGSSIMPVDKLQNAISPNQMHCKSNPVAAKKQTLLDSYFTFVLSHKSLECLLSPQIQLYVSFPAVHRE